MTYNGWLVESRVNIYWNLPENLITGRMKHWHYTPTKRNRLYFHP